MVIYQVFGNRRLFMSFEIHGEPDIIWYLILAYKPPIIQEGISKFNFCKKCNGNSKFLYMKVILIPFR